MNVAIRELGRIPASRFLWAWAAGVLSFAAAASAEPLTPRSDLPAEAIAALEQYEAESDALMRRAEAALRERREQLIEQLQAIQDRHTRAADLDAAVAVRDRIRALRGAGRNLPYVENVKPAPVNMSGYRDRVGESFVFRICGTAHGSVWGTDLYTYDSDLAAAAVHCGVLGSGETALLRVTMFPPLKKYVGSVRFGVQSYDWENSSGTYESYEICRAAAEVAGAVFEDPGNLADYSQRIGETVRFRVVGTADGSLWGTGLYSYDSDLSTAAVHAGLLEPGQVGVVCVTIHPGPSRFTGSTAHGVASSDWNNSQGHYSAYQLSVESHRSRNTSTATPEPTSRRTGRSASERVLPNIVN